MIRLKKFLLIALLCASSQVAMSGISFAQESSKIFVGESVIFHSDTLNEDRTLLIYTPAGYNSNDDRYPVMYLLDGAEHFVHVTGIIHYLSGIGHIPQMIMVAIPNTRRTHDLTPTHNDEFPSSGGGEKFLAFLENELIPYIDNNYKTHPYRIIAGHSLAGTFVVYTMITKPELFGAYLSISPSLGWDNEVVVKRAKSFFQKQARFDKFFYLTLGNEGERKYSIFEDFTNALKRTKPRDFKWDYVFMRTESHLSIPHNSIYYGLQLLYEDWTILENAAPAGIQAVLNHYGRLSEKFGYTVSPSESFLNSLGYHFLGSNNMDEALKYFAHNIKLYPNSANVYDSYGEALEKSGQLEKALENYQIAYTKSKDNADPNENIFKQNYERLKNQLGQ